MQHMPDKEFDQLFRDKFEDAEIEPSANLWANIEDQLEPKKKRGIPIYWMAAASVLIAISAMLVFQKTDKIQLRADNEFVSTVKPADEFSPAVQETADEVVENVVERSNSSLVAKVDAGRVEPTNSTNIQLAVQPIQEADRLPIKQQEVMPLAIVPIKETIIENPIVIAQVTSKQDVEPNVISETDNFPERKGIRNVGDLVNFVVDKVDKREKKLLKFNTDDDDNSSIVGINIGFLKLNKKNK
jgi:hypothetical protein